MNIHEHQNDSHPASLAGQNDATSFASPFVVVLASCTVAHGQRAGRTEVSP